MVAMYESPSSVVTFKVVVFFKPVVTGSVVAGKTSLKFAEEKGDVTPDTLDKSKRSPAPAFCNCQSPLVSEARVSTHELVAAGYWTEMLPGFFDAEKVACSATSPGIGIHGVE